MTQKYKAEWDAIKDVRNFYSHETKLGLVDWVVPSIEVIEKMDEMIEYYKRRPLALDIAISRKDVYFRQMTDFVKPTMKHMRACMYTHVPIMENGRIVGIFDENSIFGYLSENEILMDKDDDLTFEEIQKYLSIDGREMEKFIFVNRNTYVDDLIDRFERYFRRDIRLGAVFITETGDKNEIILGMLTPWDILGQERE